ncbi:glycosyltransferase family 39 protein [Chytridium lagenaria]|nr:glycosyltransferase family 39 protein [Chytridium lagenaria]
MSSEVRKRKTEKSSPVAEPAKLVTATEDDSPKVAEAPLKGDTFADQVKHFAADAKFEESRSSVAWTIMLIVVSALSFFSRAYRIDHPNQVVFDEVHFGKFASYYLRREYFFDVHPPLGKLLLAGMGVFLGYDGHFLFENIGDDYIANKLMPATFGALVVPLGISIYGATFGAALLILDSMLMFFGIWTIYNWVRFFKERQKPFSANWWIWLAMTGVGLACTLGVKMVGLFTIASVGIATLVDLWRLLDFKRGVSNQGLFVSSFYHWLYTYHFFNIHFEILTLSGPGDAFMSPSFQAELRGSGPIPYARENSVFLHSHVDRYPLRYEDGRVSSQGQQVTGYPHKDPNNEWEVVPVDPVLYPAAAGVDLSAEEKRKGVRYLRHEDVVRLRHVVTDSYLFTHDVASPLTTTNMEVSTYPSASDQAVKYNDTLWRVEITDGETNMKVRSRRSHFRLISVFHKVAIHANKAVLPDWGFGQSEINGNKNHLESSNVWLIEDVSHETIVNGTEVNETGQAEKSNEKKRSFLSKFIELQNLMISHNAGLTKPHPYSSTPITWPFVLRGISFWEVKEGLKQIYLLGNPLVWWTSITGTLMYVAMWVLDRILLRRGIDDFGTSIRRWWDRSVGFLFITWLLHWLPFFLMGRMLFLHHYLPSFIFSTLVATCVFEFIGRIVLEDPIAVAKGNVALAERIPFRAWMKRAVSFVYISFLLILLGAFGYSFYYFAPLTYGLGFDSVESIRERKWLSSWDLQHA